MINSITPAEIDELSTEEELLELRQFAIDAFGSEEVAKRWLSEEHRFYRFTPVVLAQTKKGLKEVKRIVGAIAYGGCV